MTIFRPFRNGDPPALVDLWNRGLPDRGVVRPLSAHEFDTLVMGKLGFDRLGLIVAENDGQVVGFAHAGFGPREPTGPSHELDTTMGTVAMMVTDPDRESGETASGLIHHAERYLRSRGAQVIYAGGQSPLNPFYAGIYGGSEFSGVLAGHASFSRAVLENGYEPSAQTVILEADLAIPEPRDPKSTLLRRQLRLQAIDDAMTAGWWDALALGHFRPTRFELIDKALNFGVARAWTYDIAGGYSVGDGRCRTALIDVYVEPNHRRKGYGRHLIGEILRAARSQNTEVLNVQTSTENLAGIGLYHSLGFEPVNTATLYRLPASLVGRSDRENPFG